MDEFRKEVLKVHKPRIHEVKNSNGVYDSYKWIRKNKWLDIGRPITEHEFYTIIRQVNKLFVESLLKGEDIIFPQRMGALELGKCNAKITIEDGKVVARLPIDWDRTLKLWSEDEEAYKERTLVKVEEKEVFKVFYNKRIANYNNKIFYTFEANRDLKIKLKIKIKDKAIDAFKLYG